jgi:hypothetical protein
MIPVGTATITGTPPQPGNTVISGDSQWINEVIYLNQSLVIQNGGALTLENTTIYMNCTTSDGQYYIRVESGGTLNITKNSKITNIDTNYHYDFWYDAGSFGQIKDSVIEYAGYPFVVGTESMGIRISSDYVTVDNATVRNSAYFGIFVNYSSPTIRNSFFIDNYKGIGVGYGSPLIDHVNVSSSYRGIQSWFSNHDITNSSFYNNSDRGIDISDSTVNVVNCTFTSDFVGMDYDSDSAGNVTDCKFISAVDTGLLSSPSLYISNCSFEGNQIGLLLLSAASIVDSCNFTSNLEAIKFNSDSSSVINSTIDNCVSYDLHLSAGNSHPTLLNTTFDKSKVYYSNTASDLTVKWYLHVYVQDSISAPVPWADVRVWDNDNGTYTENKTGGADGYARWFPVTEYVQSDNNGDKDGTDPGETVYYTPHSIRAMNETSHAYINATVDMTKTVTVTLPSDSAPEPPSGLTAERQWMDIELDWTASPSPDTAFYRIFRSIDPGVFDFGSPFDTTTFTNWTDVNGATDHYTYHYVVRTVDDGGNEEGNAVLVWNGDWVVNDTQVQNDLAAAINGSVVVTGNGSLTLSRNNITCWDVTVQNGGTLNIDNSTGEFFGNLDTGGALRIEDSNNITLTGNTYVRSGGALDLMNSTYVINCSSDGHWRISVFSGGVLNVTEGSVITAKNTNLEYDFWYKSGSFGSIRNSTVSEAGYSNVGGSTGIMIESNDVVVDNATIANNNRGLFIKSSSPLIKNTNISYCSTEGIQIQSGAPIISDVYIHNAGTGIWNDWGAPKMSRINLSWCGWGLRMQSSAITIRDLHIENSFQTGVNLLDNSDSTFYNSSINNSGGFDVSLGTGSDPVFVNTTFNASKITTGHPSSLTVKWYVHVLVMDSLGNPVAGANVRYQDNANGTYDKNFTTDTEGFVRWVPVTQVIYLSPNEQPKNYTPYLISANKTGIGANSIYLDFNRSTTVIIFLINGTLLDLEPGWNLISLSRIQSNTNLQTVLQSIEGQYDAVQWYNATDGIDPWKHHHISKPLYLNDLEDINHTMGLWVHITEPGGAALEVNGDVFSFNQNITLYPGWNLVGYPSNTAWNRTDALNNIDFGSDVDAIWTYNATTQTWKEITASDNFEVGMGYWIHSKVTKVWDVPL